MFLGGSGSFEFSFYIKFFSIVFVFSSSRFPEIIFPEPHVRKWPDKSATNYDMLDSKSDFVM